MQARIIFFGDEYECMEHAVIKRIVVIDIIPLFLGEFIYILV